MRQDKEKKIQILAPLNNEIQKLESQIENMEDEIQVSNERSNKFN